MEVSVSAFYLGVRESWMPRAAPTYRGRNGPGVARNSVSGTRAPAGDDRTRGFSSRLRPFLTRLVLPNGLAVADEPYVPEVRRLYWLSSVLLDAFDPEPERPAVVLVISQRPGGEIFVGLRSSSERNGTSHDKQPGVGLTKEGFFSRGRPISPDLWTPNNARSIDLLLDEATFAFVWKDLVPEDFV